MKNLLLALAMVATFAVAAAGSMSTGQASNTHDADKAACCPTGPCGECSATCCE